MNKQAYIDAVQGDLKIRRERLALYRGVIAALRDTGTKTERIGKRECDKISNEVMGRGIANPTVYYSKEYERFTVSYTDPITRKTEREDFSVSGGITPGKTDRLEEIALSIQGQIAESENALASMADTIVEMAALAPQVLEGIRAFKELVAKLPTGSREMILRDNGWQKIEG